MSTALVAVTLDDSAPTPALPICESEWGYAEDGYCLAIAVHCDPTATDPILSRPLCLDCLSRA